MIIINKKNYSSKRIQIFILESIFYSEKKIAVFLMETILSEYSQFFQKVFMKMKECSDFRTFLGLYRMTDTEF